jgi:cell division protein FtsL
MQLNQLTTFLLVDESSIVTMLIVVTVFFAVLLLLGIRKSYKLKKENERLDAINKKIAEEKEKPYQDFTEGHMYGDN